MEGDEHAVARGVDVGLEIAVAHLDGGTKGPHRVLGCLIASAPVGNGERALRLEEGPSTHHRTVPWGGRRYRDRVHPSLRFAELLASPGSAALDEGALLIAAHADRGLDPALTLRRLDDLAARCRAPTLDGLRHLLFDEIGFRGAVDNYHDPVNSMLDRVVLRRTGLPITLAVVMIEVGRRLGVPLDGVGMPGHFLVRDRVLHDVFIDPFACGAVLDRRGARARFAALMGPAAPFDDAYLEPTPAAQILGRMVANLVGAYRRNGDLVGLAWACRLRLLCPGVTVPEQVALAGDAARTGQLALAARTLEQVVELAHQDDESIDEHHRAIVRLRSGLN